VISHTPVILLVSVFTQSVCHWVLLAGMVRSWEERDDTVVKTYFNTIRRIFCCCCFFCSHTVHSREGGVSWCVRWLQTKCHQHIKVSNMKQFCMCLCDYGHWSQKKTLSYFWLTAKAHWSQLLPYALAMQ